jgi:hypothetical protein
MQTPEEQSVELRQAAPGRHGLQFPPPQSTAVSDPFAMPSVQVPGMQAPSSEHKPDWQSVSRMQP